PWLPLLAWAAPLTVFETTSPYHHIRVIEDKGLRVLYFDDASETSMSIADPLRGHFEYTEYFHMPWLWNTNISSVLMIGLGGGSVQRSLAHYYPRVQLDTVEIDPSVVRVAEALFGYKESESQRIHVEDGRLFLRRTAARYDLVILDAYVQGRYGPSIPQHLATKEFFELARAHLTTNGVVAYNVIGSLNSWHAEIVGAMYRTLKSVFPQVYVFPAQTTQNIVLIATRAEVHADLNMLRPRAQLLTRTGRASLPGFAARMERMQTLPPPSAARSPVLTDDYAPVEGLGAAVGTE
ncbi:MAG TPA: fused MFS/spermidine synthase, partial [Verrucomicrobiae bacterium]|nr:fused MFS/spermidine synthase [Verrucomicrobiae bacterium]